MKKLILILLAILFIAPCASAVDNKITVITDSTMTANTVAAGATEYGKSIDLSQFLVNGYFSVYVELTGTGTAKIEYQLSNDGTTYLTPTGASDIVTAHTVSSGPGSDGKNMYSFFPMVAKFIRIAVTETGSSNAVVVTLKLAIQ